uniref:transmembrane protein 35B isoform X1 n=1 Tax=Macaca mulatta TaxID=9544 RepID=UPI0010A28BA7|nr:transmembrane protein 35B isoform X1 [Macaca mulatta]
MGVAFVASRRINLSSATSRSEMNSSVGDLGVGGCSLWDDPARFIVVPAAYALALGLGLPANVAALAVFIRSGGRLGQALLLYLFNLALADELFTLTLQPWLIYYLGLARRPPAARLGPRLRVHLRGGLRRAHQRVPLLLRTRPRARGGCLPGLRRRRPARTACAFAWLAGLAPPCQEHRWASSGLASVTVAFFAAAFLLVLPAYVSLARALQAPSGPGPASAGAHPRAAKTMVLGLLLVFALSLAPYHLLLAPRVAGRDSDGDRCRAASTLDNPAHPQPGAAEPQQLPGPTHLMFLRAPLPPGLLLGTELPPGARGLLGLLLESLLASPPVSPPCHPPSGIQGGESSLERPRF